MCACMGLEFIELLGHAFLLSSGWWQHDKDEMELDCRWRCSKGAESAIPLPQSPHIIRDSTLNAAQHVLGFVRRKRQECKWRLLHDLHTVHKAWITHKNSSPRLKGTIQSNRRCRRRLRSVKTYLINYRHQVGYVFIGVCNVFVWWKDYAKKYTTDFYKIRWTGSIWATEETTTFWR